MVKIPDASGTRSSARRSSRPRVDSGAGEQRSVSSQKNSRRSRPRLRGKSAEKHAERPDKRQTNSGTTERLASTRDANQKRSVHTGSSGGVIERLELDALSTAELHEVMDFCASTIQQRRMEDADLDAILDEGFSACFNGKGVATTPVVVSGIVAIPGSVLVKNAAGNHECNLYTVRINDEDRWSWDFEERILLSRTFYDGELRRTITLYPAIDGMLIFGHDRKKGQKKGSAFPVHTYKSGGVRALKLVMDDDMNGHFIAAAVTDVRPLPLPSGIEE